MAKMNIFQKIKLGLQVYGEVKRMNKGLFTTEFWFSIITVIGLLLSVFLDKIPPASLILVVGLLPSIYTIARTLAKRTSSTLDDEIIEKIEQAILKKLPGYVEPPHE